MWPFSCIHPWQNHKNLYDITNKEALVNKTKCYLDNWRLSKVKFNTLNQTNAEWVKWDWKQSPARHVYAAGFHQEPLLKKLHALHNGANYVKLKLESQINWRSCFLPAHNVQWKLLNNATARSLLITSSVSKYTSWASSRGAAWCVLLLCALSKHKRILQLNWRLGNDATMFSTTPTPSLHLIILYSPFYTSCKFSARRKSAMRMKIKAKVARTLVAIIKLLITIAFLSAGFCSCNRLSFYHSSYPRHRLWFRLQTEQCNCWRALGAIIVLEGGVSLRALSRTARRVMLDEIFLLLHVILPYSYRTTHSLRG